MKYKQKFNKGEMKCTVINENLIIIISSNKRKNHGFSHSSFLMCQQRPTDSQSCILSCWSPEKRETDHRGVSTEGLSG